MMKTHRMSRSLTLWALLIALLASSSSAALRGGRFETTMTTTTTATTTLSVSAAASQRQRLAMEDKNKEEEETLMPTEFPSSAPSDEPFMTLPPGEQGGGGTNSNPVGDPQPPPPNDSNSSQGGNDNIVLNLLPFSLTVAGSLKREESILRADLEEYLAAELAASLDQSVQISLEFSTRRLKLSDESTHDNKHRELQQTATRLQYVGTATFVNDDGTAITTPTTNAFGVSELPTQNEVQVAQIVALEDTSLLQQYLDATTTTSSATAGGESDGSNPNDDDSVVVMAIVVNDRFPVPGPIPEEPPSQIERPVEPAKGSGGGNNNNSTIVAAIAAVCVVVLLVICCLVFRHYHSKPPPPPPLECEIIPDVSEGDSDKNVNGGGGGAKHDPNMELVLKEPAKDEKKQNGSKRGVFSGRNLLSGSNHGGGGNDGSTDEDDGSPNNLNKTASRTTTEEESPASQSKKNKGFFSRLSKNSLYSESVIDMTVDGPTKLIGETKTKKSQVEQHHVEISGENEDMETTSITYGYEEGQGGEAILKDLSQELSKGMSKITVVDKSKPTESILTPPQSNTVPSQRTQSSLTKESFDIATIKSMLSNDEDSMAGYSLATDFKAPSVASGAANDAAASSTPGTVLNKWFTERREFLSQKNADDPATSDSESARSSFVQHGNNETSILSQIGLAAAMNSSDPLLTAEYMDGSVEVGQPELFVDDDDDDEELYNSSYKEEDNMRGDSSVLSGLLSQASDLDGVYTTAGDTLGDESTLASFPPRTHHPGGGGGGVGIALYRASPSGEGFRFYEGDSNEATMHDESSTHTPQKSPSFDEFHVESAAPRRIDDYGHLAMRKTQQTDTYSDVPSDELNAMKGSEQDLSGFDQNPPPRQVSPENGAISNRQTKGASHYDYDRKTMIQDRQQQIRHELNALSTPDRPKYSGRTSRNSGYPPRSPEYPQYTSYGDAPVAVSPASTASYNSADYMDGDPDYDATVQQYLKERRRIKRATRKQRAERKQPPVTMEV